MNALCNIDYYPFGMLMPGRNDNVGKYRFGFNGKENDNEVKVIGSQQDYGMRIYDPRLGKFLSVDPITKDYPELTPYQFSSNTPIQAIDLDGLEACQAGKDNSIKSSTEDTFVDWMLNTSLEDKFMDLVGDDLQTIMNYQNGDAATKNKIGHVKGITTMVSLSVNVSGVGEAMALIPFKKIISTLPKLSTVSAPKVIKLAGSGPVSGVIEVSSRVKSINAFKNYKPSSPTEFVYDFKNNKFAVGKPNQNLGGSPHQQLVKSIGSRSENTVGGMLQVGSDGKILTNEFSGHFGENWTPEIRESFEGFMKENAGTQVTHTPY